MVGEKDDRDNLALAHSTVFQRSEGISAQFNVSVEGYNFNHGIDYEAILLGYARQGFQATNFASAIQEIRRMLDWRPGREDYAKGCDDDTRCKIFFGYTSNMVSSGLRDIFRYLVEHKMIDVIVTTAGGVEEDLIKCLADTWIADFNLDGSALRKRGLNRIGNLIVPNGNYCKFEDWLMPIFDQLLEEQKKSGSIWTPSKVIHRLGKEIDNPKSICYWAYKNKIPIYCPALTDGSLGDIIYFHSYRNPGLVIDICGDIRSINSEAVHSKKTGMIILGGGIVKHHICNANLMRNGADFAVYINTSLEYDGSDAGALPNEAVSWGKIRPEARPVKLFCDATIAFPLIVAQTFAKLKTSEDQQITAKLNGGSV